MVDELSQMEPPQGTETLSPATPNTQWTHLKRIAFRFTFIYLALYCMPTSGRVSLLAALPFDTEWFGNWFDIPWRALSSWVAVHVFQLSGPVTVYHPTGSGDTTLDYIQVLCMFLIAAAGTVVWSITDRSRPHYRTLSVWLRLVVRFTLALTLLSYGFAKVFPLQFGPLMPSMLMQTYGDASPMGLLWTFMSASNTYRIFTGLVEVVAGLSLLFHRTTTLGAMVSAGAMLNVVLLNFSYDVPVKLYSTHLLVMSVFLLLPNASALWSFLVLHRPASLREFNLPLPDRRRLRLATRTLHALLLLSIIYSSISGPYEFVNQQAVRLRKPPLYGVWDVNAFTVDGASAATVPPEIRWRRMMINTAQYSVIQTEDGKRRGFGAEYDEAKRALKVTARGIKQAGEFVYEQPDDKRLLLRGKLNDTPVTIELSRYSNPFLLTTRGFHWINENPFNR